MAVSKDIAIRSIAKPSIKLDPMIATDRTNDGKFTKKETFDSDEKLKGYKRPFITINGYRVDTGLISFNLNTDGFMPVCKFTFKPTNDLFFSVYPKDGDVFSVYIRSVAKVYKPIRMDFNILTVEGPNMGGGPGNSDGKIQTFTIMGECRIPGLYTSKIKSFSNKTSYDTLLEVSQDLSLGFSSNDPGLNDSMTWICPSFSCYDFIHEVTKRSYKDEKSYFDTWIDPYYNLNFVNMGNQFAKETMEPDTAIGAVSQYDGFDVDDTYVPGTEIPTAEFPLILTNVPAANGTPLYIYSYTLVSRAGQVANMTGYVHSVKSYNSSSQLGPDNSGYVSYDIEAITTETIDDGTIVQKGRPTEEIYKNERRSSWLGEHKIGDSSNTHDNYLHAEVQNKINLLDSTKFSLRLEFSKFMPFIYKGQVVPVQIYVNSKGLRKVNTGKKEDASGANDGKPVLDRYLSGLYVVTGYDIVFNKGPLGIRQVLNLSKKTWKLNTAGGFPKYYPQDTGVGDV